jgi:hypothetical protein
MPVGEISQLPRNVAMHTFAHVKEGAKHRRNNEDTNPQMSSLLVFNRVDKLEIQLVTLVF